MLLAQEKSEEHHNAIVASFGIVVKSPKRRPGCSRDLIRENLVYQSFFCGSAWSSAGLTFIEMELAFGFVHHASAIDESEGPVVVGFKVMDCSELLEQE